MGQPDDKNRYDYHNPLLDTDTEPDSVAANRVAFVDELLGRDQASAAAQEIAEVRKEVVSRVAVAREKIRRAANRADLIERIALGQFAPDLQHAVHVGEVISARRFDLLEFDLRTLFPGVESPEVIEAYLRRFRVPRDAPQVCPRFSFPMALMVEGDPHELNDASCGSWTTMESLRQAAERYPEKERYHLNGWTKDLEQSWSLDSTALFSLPVLEDPADFTLDDLDALDEMGDGPFARALLKFCEDKARELGRRGIRFKAPLIRRALIVLPGSANPGEYGIEFLPQIQFSQSFGAPLNSYSHGSPLAAYDPYALVQGRRNDCANFLIQQTTRNYPHLSETRVKLKSPKGREQALAVHSFLNMDLADRIAHTTEGTVDGDYMGNRLGLLLFPGQISEKPSEPSSTLLPHQMMTLGSDLGMRSSGSASRSRTRVGEASVRGGSEGFFTASKNPGYNKRFAYQNEGQPILYMVRYMTVVRGQ